MAHITQQNMLRIAQSLETPAATLRRLAKEGNWAVQEALTYNYYTPPDALDWLARNVKQTAVLCGVAMNINTPSEALAWLAKREPHAIIQRRIAANTSTPPETLAWLAENSDVSVLYLIVRNEKTPRHVKFLVLLEYPEWAKELS